MKTEHKKLKEVCDKIGYDYGYDTFVFNGYDNKFYNGYNTEANRDEYEGEPVDVRVIIFTPEFMDKFEDYCYKNIDKDLNMFKIMIMSNLNNPVEYLYNLIFNNK